MTPRTIVVLAVVFCCAAIAAAEEGLVGHWSFDDKAPEQIMDQSGKGNHGTCIGKDMLVKAGKGAALSLDGQRKCVSIPSSDSLDLSETGTISLWVFIRAYDDKPAYPAFIQKGQKVGWVAGSYHIFYHTLNKVIYGAVNVEGGAQYVCFGKPTIGAWHNLVFAWDDTSIYGYLDGEIVELQPLTHPVPKTKDPLWIGRSLYGSPNALIDEVKLYNRALTEEAVVQAYDATKAAFVKPSDK